MQRGRRQWAQRSMDPVRPIHAPSANAPTYMCYYNVYESKQYRSYRALMFFKIIVEIKVLTMK